MHLHRLCIFMCGEKVNKIEWKVLDAEGETLREEQKTRGTEYGMIFCCACPHWPSEYQLLLYAFIVRHMIFIPFRQYPSCSSAGMKSTNRSPFYEYSRRQRVHVDMRCRRLMSMFGLKHNVPECTSHTVYCLLVQWMHRRPLPVCICSNVCGWLSACILPRFTSALSRTYAVTPCGYLYCLLLQSRLLTFRVWDHSNTPNVNDQSICFRSFSFIWCWSGEKLKLVCNQHRLLSSSLKRKRRRKNKIKQKIFVFPPSQQTQNLKRTSLYSYEPNR